MTLTRAASLLAATALAVTGLTACGDDTAPEPTASTASPIDKGADEPSDTASSEVTTGVPEAFKENTKAGATAFTESWFEMSGEAMQGGDISVVESHTHKDCAVCWELIDRIKADASDHIRADMDPIQVTEMSSRERSDGGYRVEFTMVNPAYSKVDESGTKVATFEASSVTVVTDTHWTGDAWTMRGWIIK